MEFEVKLRSAEVVIGEPVGVSLRLVTGPGPTKLPLDYNTTDVTTFVLMDAEGRVLGQADGYVKTWRLGNPAARKPQSVLRAEPVDPGRELDWSEDLLAHFDLTEPGSYLVEVRFRFEPSGIDLVSPRLPLTIRPNRCRFLDVSQDRVCLPTTCFVVQHRGEDEARTFVRVSDAMNPDRFWEGVSLDLSPDAEPIASEADFATTLTFQHDFVRWLGWIEGGSLRLTQVQESRPPGPVFEVPLPLSSPALFGRPVQHADRSVSVTLLGSLADGGRGVFRVEVLGDGQSSALVPLVSLGAGDVPMAAAPDVHGSLFIVAAAHPGYAPLSMLERRTDGSAAHRELLPAGLFHGERPRELRILAVRLDLKPFRGPRAALVAGMLDHDPGDPNQDDVLTLLQIFLDAPPAGKEAVTVTSVPLWRGFFAPGEAVSSVDLVRVRRTELHALWATSHGRLLQVLPDGSLRSVTQVAPLEAEAARLVTTPDHEVHLFLPVEGRGVVGLPLVKVARP